MFYLGTKRRVKTRRNSGQLQLLPKWRSPIYGPIVYENSYLTKTNLLMLFRETVVVCCENRMGKKTNILRRQNPELFNIKVDGTYIYHCHWRIQFVLISGTWWSLFLYSAQSSDAITKRDVTSIGFCKQTMYVRLLTFWRKLFIIAVKTDIVCAVSQILFLSWYMCWQVTNWKENTPDLSNGRTNFNV
jgi:hypothetical protein